MRKFKHIFTTLLLLTILSFNYSCNPKEKTLQVSYLREGQLKTEAIPLDFINENGELVSPYISSVKFAHLDSVCFKYNHPDSMEVFTASLPLDLKKEIEKYSPEYYAAFSVYNIHKAIEYYNKLFENKIDFDFRPEYRELEIVFGDIPLFTTPKSYIFEKDSNPSPSLFFTKLYIVLFGILKKD